jgi:hypothetical protein
MNRSLRPLLAALLCLGLSGCVLGTMAHEAVGLIGTESQKKSTLSGTLAEFHKELYWGSGGNGSRFLSTEAAKPDLGRRLGLEFSDPTRKIVDVQVRNITFEDEANRAEVDTIVRFFRTPTYTVEVETKRESWGYERLNGGWKLSEVVTLGHENDTGKFGRIVP